ncbi:MAG: CPBP family intramembrane glutamic endopeptidase [Polyangia bacterium]
MSEDSHPAGRVPTPRARPAIVEVLLVFLLASALAAVLTRLSFIGFIRDNLHAFVAAGFLFLPQLMLRKRGDLEAYGLRADPVKLGLQLAGGLIFVVLPLFVVGFWVWNRWACAHVPSLVPGSCWHLLHPHLVFPPSFGMLAVAQLVVVAFPEELFFRGYIMGRLEDALPPTRMLLGAPVGWALVVQAILFGLGHVLVTFDPMMFTRAIPGLLFGWLFSRTRSVLAGTIFHAACNLLIEVLAMSLL